MQIQDAIRLLRETCVLRHLSLNTERSYVHCIERYGRFLLDRKLALLTPERKMEAFLTHLATSGVAASTQNQAFHALLGGAFVRDIQVVLGHKHLETTMRHLHSEAERVVSPLQDYVSSPTRA